MAVVDLSKLLALQEADTRRLELERQLQAVPRDIGAVEARIAAEKQAIDVAKTEWRELEARKKTLETEIKSAEERAARYRTQQLEVRKNDEYRALTHEIETTETTIGGFEEEELKILYAIDGAKERFAAAEAVLKANISGHEGRIRALREREAQLKGEHAGVAAEVAAARAHVPEVELRLYERLAARPGHPVCVPVQAGRCGGCHMKVSANVEFEARRGENLTTCDQCSRVVYWKS
ncbi:MAG TPA: C4-type zinc ribbon domain-containing protein [Opitutaceae bacterium]|nr:C4-type zinc ribbon domain-containing protein [Opitutaceae bacterium]